MSSYYDDPDFADEYRWRDEEALTAAIREREIEADITRASRLWHKPADDEQRVLAESGRAFVTRCGLRARRATARQKPRQLPPIERCVVCTDEDAP